jgi:hypothetical protein
MGDIPTNLGDYAERGFIAEQRGGLDWWQTCITSALIDLNRVPGFVTAFAGVAKRAPARRVRRLGDRRADRP